MTSPAPANADGPRRTVKGLLGRLHPRAAAGQVVSFATAQVVGGLVSAAWLLVAAHHLGRFEFGNLTLIISLSGILLPFCDLGLATALGIEVARRQVLDPTVLQRIVLRRVVLAILCSVIAGVLYVYSAWHATIWVPIVFTGFFVGNAIFTTETAALRSLDRTYVDALNTFLSRVAILIFGVILLARGGGLLVAVSLYAAAAIISAIVVSLVTKRHTRVDQSAQKMEPFHIRRTYIFAIATVSATIYVNFDTWLLATLTDTSISGAYAAADRVLDAALFPAAALAILGENRYPRYSPTHRQRLLTFVVVAGVLSTIVPIVIVLFGAPEIMGLLFGSSYRADANVLILLILSAPFGAVMIVLAVPVILSWSHWYGVMLGAGLVLNIILNLVLDPRWGASGAAVANLATDGLMASVFIVAMLYKRWGAVMNASSPILNPEPA